MRRKIARRPKTGIKKVPIDRFRRTRYFWNRHVKLHVIIGFNFVPMQYFMPFCRDMQTAAFLALKQKVAHMQLEKSSDRKSDRSKKCLEFAAEQDRGLKIRIRRVGKFGKFGKFEFSDFWPHVFSSENNFQHFCYYGPTRSEHSLAVKTPIFGQTHHVQIKINFCRNRG